MMLYNIVIYLYLLKFNIMNINFWIFKFIFVNLLLILFYDINIHIFNILRWYFYNNSQFFKKNIYKIYKIN